MSPAKSHAINNQPPKTEPAAAAVCSAEAEPLPDGGDRAVARRVPDSEFSVSRAGRTKHEASEHSTIAFKRGLTQAAAVGDRKGFRV
jgi:hypothetical protein